MSALRWLQAQLWLTSTVIAMAGCDAAVTFVPSPGVAVPTSGHGTPTSPGKDSPDDPVVEPLDVALAQATYTTTGDIMRYIIAPGCAAENNECHNNEHFPDMSSEGNLWNLIALGCNQGVADRPTVEDFCEAQGDEIRIEDGVNAGFVARIGSIVEVTNAGGEFVEFAIYVDTTPEPQMRATFSILRNGLVDAGLGGGSSMFTFPDSNALIVRRAGDIPQRRIIKQGDENGNAIYGDGRGVLVRRGDARNSYLIRRLVSAGSSRLRMPLNFNSDNPTEINRPLLREEMYALMSWINCVRADDDVYSPVRYDCVENAQNGGVW